MHARIHEQPMPFEFDEPGARPDSRVGIEIHDPHKGKVTQDRGGVNREIVVGSYDPRQRPQDHRVTQRTQIELRVAEHPERVKDKRR